MTDKTSDKKPLALAIGTAFAASLAAAPMAGAAENPFAMNELSGGYMQLAGSHMEGKCGEGKCGGKKETASEGKCGGTKSEMEKMEKEAEGKCGEGKCGGAKPEKSSSEGKCGGAKPEKSSSEGKCGEGKCGGSM